MNGCLPAFLITLHIVLLFTYQVGDVINVSLCFVSHSHRRLSTLDYNMDYQHVANYSRPPVDKMSGLGCSQKK